jgi:hypothetical protein
VARTILKSAVVSPKTCAVMATANAQVPEGSAYKAGNSISAADKTSITVTVGGKKADVKLVNAVLSGQ